MNGAGGVGFVINTAALFVLLVAVVALGGIWLWLRRKAVER